MQSLPKNLSFKKETLEIILNASYQRNKRVLSYDGIPKKSLKSKVIFFKPKEDIFSISWHGLAEVIESKKLLRIHLFISKIKNYSRVKI